MSSKNMVDRPLLSLEPLRSNLHTLKLTSLRQIGTKNVLSAKKKYNFV